MVMVRQDVPTEGDGAMHGLNRLTHMFLIYRA